jgi:uroporphyrinogen-III synthase
MTRVLITRPQPGAADTAERLRALGHEPVVAPLFEVRAKEWSPPAAMPEAVMLTSAAAAREGGPAMAPYLGLPCFCVGARTAAAAQDAGFTDIRTPEVEDGGELLAAIAEEGIGDILHLSGIEIASYPPPAGLRRGGSWRRAWCAPQGSAPLGDQPQRGRRCGRRLGRPCGCCRAG